MDFKEAFREGLQKSLVANGCDSREQFWRFFIVYFPIACVIPTLISVLVPMIFGYESMVIAMIIFALACIAVYIPLITAIIRRLHDVGKPGYFWILWFVPVVNLYVFYLLAKKGVA